MADNSNYSQMFKPPKRFTYNDIICECVDINSALADSILLNLIPSKSDPAELVQFIPQDPYFRFLIAYHYHLIVQDIQVRIEIDEIEGDAHLYVYCKTVPSRHVLNAYTEQTALFVEDIGRNIATIHSASYPFTIHNVKDTMSDGNTTTVHGFLSYRVAEIPGVPFNHRAFAPYAVTITVNTTNLAEIRENIPHYNVNQHKQIIMRKVFGAIIDCENAIRHKISPNDFIKVKFNYFVLEDPLAVYSVATMCYRVVLIPSQYNGYEILDVAPSTMLIRPPKAFDFFNQVHSCNWSTIYQTCEFIATALLSDHGTLFIPEVVEHDIEIRNDKKYVRVHMRPHIAYFTDKFIHFSDGDIIRHCAQEMAWFVSRFNNNFEFAFPMSGSLENPETICYMRCPTDYFKKENMKELETMIKLFAYEKWRFRVVAETEMWTYFMLADMSIYQYDRSDSHEFFNYFKEEFLCHISSKESTSLEDACDALIGTFTNIYDIGRATAMADDAFLQPYKNKYHDNEHIIFGLWETAIRMEHRSWYGTYAEIRDRLIRSIKPQPELDEEAMLAKIAAEQELQPKKRKGFLSKFFGSK